MADAEEKIVQDANSNLVCGGFLGDQHDPKSEPESCSKDDVTDGDVDSPSESPTPSAAGATAQQVPVRQLKSPPMSADGLNHNELVLLERAYHESPYPSYQQLGKKLGITPFKVKCWFRKRRRNLHQESGAEMSIEEETRVFKQFIDDHAAGRTIPSIILPSNRPMHQPIPVNMVSCPGPSGENGGPYTDNGQKLPQSFIAVPNPLAIQQMTGTKRPRESTKEPKVATVRPSKAKSKKARGDNQKQKSAAPMMQPVFPGLLPVTQPIPSPSGSMKNGNHTTKQKAQTPDTTSTTMKREVITPTLSPSPAPSSHSDSGPSPEQTPLFYKNPQIAELMQEREYLGRLLHEQQMQALETRKKLIDVDRELARVSAQLQSQYPYQTPENWAFMAAAHPQLLMIAQAQQQLLHAQNVAVMETQNHYLTPNQGQVLGLDSRSNCTTPEPDGQSMVPHTDYGLSRPDSHSEESNA